MKDDTLYSAFKNWEKLSSTHEEALAYEARMKVILDKESAQREAELREEEARQEGLEIGEKKGRQKGEEQGKEVIARRLLEKGMDIEGIAEVTGLGKKRIIELQD